MARFTNSEILDLIDIILVAVEDAENNEVPSPLWVADMREWCVLLLDRIAEGGD